MLLTIFTPTYNRSNTLPRLFQSLCKQNCDNFEWLVVDDGSSDNTEDLIAGFISTAHFPIRYIKQSNGGKHTAHNTALKYAQGNYFFTVDSDDWLSENSIQKIRNIIESNKSIFESKEICGLLALKSFENGKIIGTPFSKNNFIAGLYGLEHNGERGERSIIFKSDVIRNYPFPIISGERFMTESVIYDRIDQSYKFFVVNEILTVCEYQAEGLSSNPRQLMHKYPGGYFIYFMQRANYSKHPLETVKYLIQANCFSHLHKAGQPKCHSNNLKILYYLLKPLGWIASFHYKKFAD